MKTFADRIRHARKMRRLSQSELARASGLAQSTISSYENRSRASTTRLIALARALEVNPFWLDTGKGSWQPETPSQAISDVPRVRETPHALHGYAWPFTRITPQEYWSLDASERALLEDMVARLIHHFSDN